MQGTHSAHILTVNAGSSSVKFVLYESNNLTPVLKGVIDRIGMEGTCISVENIAQGETSQREVSGDAATILFETITELDLLSSLTGIGHRVVHGGDSFFKPTLLTAEVLATLDGYVSYAPRHLPIEIALIRQFMNVLPHVPQVACFDTAFHHAMPSRAQIVPVPSAYRTAGVKRYGFHGLSYEYLLQALETRFDVPVQEKRIILAHLGSGASLSAVRNGVPADTTMGFSPNSGIPMSTRTGDIDAGLFEYFTDKIGMTAEEFIHMVNYESGLLAISNTTADMEVLLKEAETNASAAEAVAFFAYHVQKQIGALAAAMGGIDTLVFTGGIGERSPEIRSRITAELSFLGIELDEAANKGNDGLVSKKDSNVSVYCIPTNEELVIAQHVARVLTDLT